MRVLIAARDLRVRRALSRLLELHGNRVVGAADAPEELLELDVETSPDLVVLELGKRRHAADLRVVGELARRGRAVIAVSSGSAACAAVLAAGATACLDKNADFTDRLAEAVRAVAGPRTPVSRRGATTGA
jgi:DNA-binding NarL/FixJ family response regulator